MNTKKIMSFLTAVAMLVTIVPITFADELSANKTTGLKLESTGDILEDFANMEALKTSLSSDDNVSVLELEEENSIITNGDMEGVNAEDNQPWWWGVTGESTGFSSSNDANSGDYSVLITSRTDVTDGLQQYISLTNGETYEITAYVKTSEADTANINIRYNYWDDDIAVSETATVGEWTKLNATYTVRESTDDTVTQIIINTLAGTGDFYVDDVTVTLIENAEQTANPDDEPPVPDDDGLLLSYDFDTNLTETEETFQGNAVIAENEGISGNAVYLDGDSSSYMLLPSDILADNMTIMMWAKSSEFRDWARLFDFGESSDTNYFYYAPGYACVETMLNGEKESHWLEGVDLTNQWVHYAVVRTDSQIKVYVNGECVHTSTATQALSEISNTSNYIGKSHYDWDASFKGYIDDIKIYQSVVDEEDIAAIYTNAVDTIIHENLMTDYESLYVTNQISDTYSLPTEGSCGSTITWSANIDGIISEDNTIDALNVGEQDIEIVLTAAVTNGTETKTRSFNVKILAKPSETGLTAYDMSDVMVTNEYIQNAVSKMADYLLSLDPARLTQGFMQTNEKTNGVDTYGGWETSLIAGHAVGHYTTAVAQAYEFFSAYDDAAATDAPTTLPIATDTPTPTAAPTTAPDDVFSLTASDGIYTVHIPDSLSDIAYNIYVASYDSENCLTAVSTTLTGTASDHMKAFIWNNDMQPLADAAELETATLSIAEAEDYTSEKTYAAEMLERSEIMIDYFDEAQIKEDGTANGYEVKTGYLFASTVPNWYQTTPRYGEQQFDFIENQTSVNIIEEAWVPWYTMHKILAGLVDTYKLTGNETALEEAKLLGTWVYNRVKDYDTTICDDGTTLQERVLNVEYGGMNDVLYELYKITGDENHAKAAHMFDEITLFDELYEGNDVLANKHANTTIPKIIGAVNRYFAEEATEADLQEIIGDTHDKTYYLQAAENFFDMVTEDHSYITGGNSQNEHFRTAHTEDSYRDNINCETCNTYNMLKLARMLYTITGEKKYFDYYENTLLNAIISSQNPETGMTTYFQPMASGYYKIFSGTEDCFWCCTGSGMESLTKLSDSIYYGKDSVISVQQFISSVLTDADNNIKLTQESEIPDGETTKITVNVINGEAQQCNIMLRVPDWTTGQTVMLNGTELDVAPTGGYIMINRTWSDGDVIEYTMPMHLEAYGLYDSTSATAFKYGPVVLSAGLGTEGMYGTIGDSNVDEFGLNYDSQGMGVRIPQALDGFSEFIQIDDSYSSRLEWLEDLDENMVKTEGKLEFTMKNTDTELVFTPHYKRYNERYGIYWYITALSEKEILAAKESGREENIIIDSIETSHDQQENGHGFSQENTEMKEGTSDSVNYRLVKDGGYVDYQMAVDKTKTNYISVTYSADDAGNMMSIYVKSEDSEEIKIAEVTASGKDETVRYQIPDELVQQAYTAGAGAQSITGKDALHIIFRADCGTDAPKLCGEVDIVTDYDTNPNLTALTFSDGTLSPEFDGDTTEYTLDVDEDTTSVKLKADLADTYGLVYVNDVLINDASEKVVDISGGLIVITTYAEDHETSKTYTITVKK